MAQSMTTAILNERKALTQSGTRVENGVVLTSDEIRSAELGRLQELPSLGEAMRAWMEAIAASAPEDYAVDFRSVLMMADGRLHVGRPDKLLVDALMTNCGPDHEKPHPLTYRTFGNLLRHFCSPPKNVAKNMIDLPTIDMPHQHTGRTWRRENDPSDSPRAHAYNAILDKRKRHDETVTRLTGEPATTVIFRTRLLPRFESRFAKDTERIRTIIGVVSPNHCLRDGDDDKLIAALTIAFAGQLEGARGVAFRGVDESELRAVFPTLEVEVPDAGPEKWHGYVTARNSESGAKSWTISAGLYRTADGASVACEAVVRTGRHVGKKVAERMVEVAQGASELLGQLAAKAAELSGRISPWKPEELLKRLRAALAGTFAHDPDICCGIAFELGRRTADLEEPVTIGTLIGVLGQLAGAATFRRDARPIEVMLGRMMVDGWQELKAVAVETTDEEES